MTGLALWLVTDFGSVQPSRRHTVAAVWVWAADAAEAAEIGRADLKADNESDDQDYCSTVAVLDGTAPQWFEFTARAELCELQCCGGADTDDGHSGFCSQARGAA